MKQKKSQIWYMDFIISIIVVLVMLSAFFYSIANYQDKEDEDLLSDANHISEMLMGKGEPEDWNVSTVKRLGLTDGNWHFNTQKIDHLYSLSDIKLRQLFDTKSFVFLELYNQTNILEYQGKNYTGKQSVNYHKILSVSRYGLLNNSIVELRIHVWK